MTTFKIDNQSISVVLENQETYTPASGSIQKVVANVHISAALLINGAKIVQEDTRNVTDTEPLILDNNTTVKHGAFSGGIYISGFEIN
jgi:hypothetical protein